MHSYNDNYDEKHQQLCVSERKRKCNELTNDDQPAAAGGEEQQHQPPENLHCYGQQGNDAFENLHLESLTQEDLIQLVQKQLANQNETHKQLEAMKKEAEESAKQQAKEMTTKVENLQMELLASQHKVKELTAEMENLKHQKHLDCAKQAENFSQRIVQLEQEKAEVYAELGKKLAEIEEMHKKMEEKSEELAEKAKQIDALLLQLNESSHQHQMPTDQQMKIQLSLETWYDWLAYVPRHRLGQIVPMIGDRKFGSIVQKFLHEYGEIKIAGIQIVAPYEEDPNGHPRVRALQNNRLLRFEMPEAQMPANIKNFDDFELRYFDPSVLNFMQTIQQNGLLDNVTLWLDKLPSKDIIQPVLCHLLPLINGIVAIEVENSAQLVDIYDAANSKEIYEMNMKMMEETRILGLNNEYDPAIMDADRIDLYCRWLNQTARADGKPRVLLLARLSVDYSPFSLFIDRIKQDFLMATDPVSFFIRINLPKSFQSQEDICFDNSKTKERLLTKKEEAEELDDWEEVFLLISRYPQASTKKWIEENEKEVLAWDVMSVDRVIHLSEYLKLGAI